VADKDLEELRNRAQGTPEHLHKSDLTTHFTEGFINTLIESKKFTPYRHKKRARAMRVEGPFDVETRDGLKHCEDGYLLLDEDGWPTAMDLEDFRKTYESA